MQFLLGFNIGWAKNWSSWNEIIETSSRLHPLRPQNKHLHTQRITD